MSVRALPRNEGNAKVKKGIENLLPTALFEPRFYPSKSIVTDYGERRTVEEFNKTTFCRWVCDERRRVEDFGGFSAVVAILEEFVASTARADP